MTKVLLSSGGMDSFLLAHEPELKGAIHVFVDINQKYLVKEMKAAHYVAKSCGSEIFVAVANPIAKYEHESGIIPFRNAEMILCAAQFGTEIYLGVIADEINSDKSPEFLEAMEQVLNISHAKQYWTEGKTFKLLTPFRNMSKTTLVERYLANGGDLSHLLKSVSCYSASNEHCGRCASCFKRWVALTNATRKDQCESFAEHPAQWKSMSHWANAIEGYSVTRGAEIAYALSLARGLTK